MRELSLIAAGRGYSLISVRGLLIVVAFLVEEQGLQGARASVVGTRGLSSCCSRALEHRLSSSGAWDKLLDQSSPFWESQ